MEDKQTAEQALNFIKTKYETQEEAIWLAIGRGDIENEIGFEVSDEQWDAIYLMVSDSIVSDLRLAIADAVERIVGV